MKGRVEKLGPDFRHLKPRLRAPRKSDWPSPSISLTLLITLSSFVVSTFTDDVPKSSPFRRCSRVLVFPLMCQSLSLPTDTTFHSCGLWRGSTRKIRRVEHEFFYDIYHMANLQKRNSFSRRSSLRNTFRVNFVWMSWKRTTFFASYFVV